ncbi:MAG: hypothetical protein NZ888_01835 [Candidatus Nitrosocaldus sp.]|nr:hypothetical protein [Candidatus Nitrosocaldus sp.]MDW7999840.1 hypothetical protein [Candidatus Nitrosocaldus sp.]
MPEFKPYTVKNLWGREDEIYSLINHAIDNISHVSSITANITGRVTRGSTGLADAKVTAEKVVSTNGP